MVRFLTIKEKDWKNEKEQRNISVNFDFIKAFWSGVDRHTNTPGWYFDIDGYDDNDFYYFCDVSEMPLDILEGRK